MELRDRTELWALLKYGINNKYKKYLSDVLYLWVISHVSDTKDLHCCGNGFHKTRAYKY